MPKNKIPSYRKRLVRGKEKARVTLTDCVTRQVRDYILGEYDSPESRERYHRIVAEWETRGRRLEAHAETITLNDLCLRYWESVESDLGDSKFYDIRNAIQRARELYGTDPAESFGPMALRLCVMRRWLPRGCHASTLDGGYSRSLRFFDGACPVN